MLEPSLKLDFKVRLILSGRERACGMKVFEINSDSLNEFCSPLSYATLDSKVTYFVNFVI